MLVQYTICMYNTLYACTIHYMLVQYTICMYNTLYVCTIHYMQVQYTICMYNTLYVCTIHYMYVQYTICRYNTLYVCTIHYMQVQYTICMYNTLYAGTIHYMYVQLQFGSQTNQYLRRLTEKDDVLSVLNTLNSSSFPLARQSATAQNTANPSIPMLPPSHSTSLHYNIQQQLY